MLAESLCNSRLSGGASRIRTLSTLWRMWSECELPDIANRKFELAVRVSEVLSLAGANHERKRTAQLGNRDKREPWHLLGPKPAVSGSDAIGRDLQDPRNRGVFSRCFPVCAQSLCDTRLCGGESGIRTHGTYQYTRFPSVRLKPLGHLSQIDCLDRCLSSVTVRIASPGGEGGIRTLDRLPPIHP